MCIFVETENTPWKHVSIKLTVSPLLARKDHTNVSKYKFWKMVFPQVKHEFQVPIQNKYQYSIKGQVCSMYIRSFRAVPKWNVGPWSELRSTTAQNYSSLQKHMWIKNFTKHTAKLKIDARFEIVTGCKTQANLNCLIYMQPVVTNCAITYFSNVTNVPSFCFSP